MVRSLRFTVTLLRSNGMDGWVDDLKEVQTILLKNKYPLSVELDFLPGTKGTSRSARE